MTAALKPFGSDAEYLEAESHWLKVRAHRMQAEDEIRRQEEQVVSWPPRRGELAPSELTAKLEALIEVEDNTRSDIDAQLHAGVRGGTLLGLDRLQHEHKLDDFERIVLLVAAMPALDRSVSDLLEGLDRVGWIHQTTEDKMMAVAELGSRGAQSASRTGGEGRGVKEGGSRISYRLTSLRGRMPACWPIIRGEDSEGLYETRAMLASRCLAAGAQLDDR